MRLTDNLIAHWKLEEDSTTTRVDSHGSYHIPFYNGAVGRVAGKIGSYAARFNDPSTNKYLRRDSIEQAVYPTGSWSFTAWVYRGTDTPTGSTAYLGLYGATYFVFSIHSEYTTGYVHRVGQTDAAKAPQSADVASALQAWEFIAARFDAGRNKLSISVNNGTPVEGTCTGKISWVDAAPTNLRIGRRDDLSQDDSVDSVSLWHRVLTDAEVALLYNSGNGLDYPFGFCMPFTP